MKCPITECANHDDCVILDITKKPPKDFKSCSYSKKDSTSKVRSKKDATEKGDI
jgi:hypothetical protein